MAEGHYYENIQIVGKKIVLGSHFLLDGQQQHVEQTIIDGGQPVDPDKASVVAFLPGTSPGLAPWLVGFTITNGGGWKVMLTTEEGISEKVVGGAFYIEETNPVFKGNIIHNNKGGDEGGGSYAIFSVPNFGGPVEGGGYNEGGNQFSGNYSKLGKTIYVEWGEGEAPAIQMQNCVFDVYSPELGDLTGYWALPAGGFLTAGSMGLLPCLTGEIFVSPEGSDEYDGDSPDSPLRTVDTALSRVWGDADRPADIHLASGIYSPYYTGERFPLQLVDHVRLLGREERSPILDSEGAGGLFCNEEAEGSEVLSIRRLVPIEMEPEDAANR